MVLFATGAAGPGVAASRLMASVWSRLSKIVLFWIVSGWVPPPT